MSFDLAVNFTIDKLEGGWVETKHATDPGGDTFAGITKRAWVACEGSSAVWPPSRDEVLAFYEREYWDDARCGELPEPLDAVVFQLAVNDGPGTAILCLHAALGLAVRSAIFGPQTAAALATWTKNVDELCGRVLSAQRQRYQDTHDAADPNIRGLLDRANLTETAALTGALRPALLRS